MSAGLVIKDTSGNIILDMTTRIPRELGSFSTGTSNGSLAVSFPAGTTWWVRSVTATTGFSGKPPAVQLNGSTFSWAFSVTAGLGEYAVGATIYYGVY